jgi:hypothetical protein
MKIMNRIIKMVVFPMMAGALGAGEKDPTTPPFAEANPTNLVKELNFKSLGGFKYEYPYEQPKGKPWELKEQFDKRVPEHIRKLDGRHVTVQGFMLPVETKKDKVLTFLLMPDQQACCFGRVPEPNEWIVVEMGRVGGGSILMDMVVEIDGNLEVAEKWEDGFFTGIYHMDANLVQKAKVQPPNLINTASGLNARSKNL